MRKQKARIRPRENIRLERSFAFEREAVDDEARTLSVAFSSGFAVERYWGTEILSHDPGAMRLGRLKDSGPVLLDHSARDLVGVIEDAEIGSDGKGRAVVRFGRSALAEEVYQDVKDGIRTKISVGYDVHKWQVDESTETFRAIDWEPFEISFVSIPADPTVGVGRSAQPVTSPEHQEIAKMEDEVKPAVTVDVRAVESQVREREIARIRELENVGRTFKDHDGEDLAREAISAGKSVGDLQAAILERVGRKPVPKADIGLTETEVRSYSLVRAINGLLAVTTGDRRAREAAAFEFEVSEAAAKVDKKEARGIIVPWDVLYKPELERMKRDLTTSVATGTSKFGYSVATNLLADSFIDVLRARTVVGQLGATMLPGLVGNVAIPRQNLASTVYWVAENSAPTEGAPTLDQVALSPKTVGGFVDFSRKLMLQGTPGVEGLVRNDLTRGIMTEVDRVALAGTGSNTPTGVLYTTGIGSVTIGTNGGAPTWAHVNQLWREVAIDNADMGSLSYVTNAQVAYKLRTTSRQSSGVEGNFIMSPEGNTLAGFPVAITQQIPANLTKGSASGTLSAMLFGNWTDLLIGMWSGIDLLVDPYTGSSAGTVRVVAFQDLDVAVRHPESFAECNEILPT